MNLFRKVSHLTPNLTRYEISWLKLIAIAESKLPAPEL